MSHKSNSTGAMAAAWFGTPGTASAVEAVFGPRLGDPKELDCKDFQLPSTAVCSPGVNMRLARMVELYLHMQENLSLETFCKDVGIAKDAMSRFFSGEEMLNDRAFALLVNWCFSTPKKESVVKTP